MVMRVTSVAFLVAPKRAPAPSRASLPASQYQAHMKQPLPSASPGRGGQWLSRFVSQAESPVLGRFAARFWA